MDIHQLKEYLKCAIDLENVKLACFNAMDEAHKRKLSIWFLDYEYYLYYPLKPRFKFDEFDEHKPTRSTYRRKISDYIGCPRWLLIVIGFVLHLIAINMLDKLLNRAITSIMQSVVDYAESYLTGLGAFVGLGMVIGAFLLEYSLIAILFRFIDEMRRSMEYKESMNEYNRNLNEYNRNKEKAERAYQKAYAKWEEEVKRIKNDHQNFIDSRDQHADLLDETRGQIMNKWSDINRKLIEHYSNGPIHKNFQNLVALTQIYLYLDSGIATELEGPNGAYAQYMNDVRTSKICDSLEQIRKDIKNGFSMIAQNQRMLYESLEEGKRAISVLSDKIQDIGEGIEAQKQLQESCLAELKNGMRTINTEVHCMTKKQSEIAMNTAMISLNQYIDMKSRGIEAYYSTYSG